MSDFIDLKASKQPERSRPDFPLSIFRSSTIVELLKSLPLRQSGYPGLRFRSILLTGKKGCGKKSLVRELFRAKGQFLIEDYLFRLNNLNTDKLDFLNHIILLSSIEEDFNNTKDVESVIDLIQKKIIANNLTFIVTTSKDDLPQKFVEIFEVVFDVQPQITLKDAPTVLEYVFYPFTLPNSEIRSQLCKSITKLSWSEIFSLASKCIRSFLERDDILECIDNINFKLQKTFWEESFHNFIDKPKFLVDHPGIFGLEKQREFLELLLSSLCGDVNENASRRKKGVLIHGPPGTGKTLLARSILEQGTVNVIVVSLGDWIHAEVGESQRSVHSTFITAKKSQPSVIFIDEFEALFGSPNYETENSYVESYGYTSRSILNQLCEEIEDLDIVRNRVMLLTATNYLEKVPKVLLGPNKIDSLVHFGPPSLPNIKSLLTSIKLNGNIHSSVDIEKIAHATIGLTVCEITSVINNASIISRSETNLSPNEVYIVSALDHLKKSKTMQVLYQMS